MDRLLDDSIYFRISIILNSLSRWPRYLFDCTPKRRIAVWRWIPRRNSESTVGVIARNSTLIQWGMGFMRRRISSRRLGPRWHLRLKMYLFGYSGQGGVDISIRAEGVREKLQSVWKWRLGKGADWDDLLWSENEGTGVDSVLLLDFQRADFGLGMICINPDESSAQSPAVKARGEAISNIPINGNKTASTP